MNEAPRQKDSVSKPPETVIVVPARMGGKRLPDKLLLKATGKTILQHTVDAALQCKRADKVIVAHSADFPMQALPATYPGGRLICVMTPPDLPTGTDRVAMAMSTLYGWESCPPLIVNWQADEPMVDPADVDRLIEASLAGAWDVGTLAFPLVSADPRTTSSATVKVVLCQRCEGHGRRALYFSRAKVPHGAACYWGHVGIYALHRSALQAFFAYRDRRSSVEQAESLEQMRFLTTTMEPQEVMVLPLKAGVGERPCAINTREDYDRFVAWWRNREPNREVKEKTNLLPRYSLLHCPDIRKWYNNAKGFRFFNVPENELSREELIAAIGHLEEERKAHLCSSTELYGTTSAGARDLEFLPKAK